MHWLNAHPTANTPQSQISLSLSLSPPLAPELFLDPHLATMAPPSVAAVQVENVEFPPIVKAPGSDKSFFLGGAGERGLHIQDKFVKFTAIGVYLEDDAIPALAAKWKGKTAEELTESVEFFREIVTGGFEKFTRVTMILPLTGQQYAEKVSENCVAIWKTLGIYTEAEEKAIDKFVSTFKDETFPPGSSILFTLSPKRSLTITFSKDGSIPEAGNVVIENKLLSEAVLESMIGKNGVSPAARKNVAARLYDLFNHSQNGSSLDLGQKADKGENGSSLDLGQKADKGENGSSLDLGQKADKGENGSSLI